MNSTNGNLVKAIFLLCAASVLAAVSASSQFGGYDLSPVIDASWRLSRGEVPERDFINTFPALFLILLKTAETVFSNYQGLVAVNILFTLLCSFMLLLIARKQSLNDRYVVPLSALFCVPLIYTGHLWHSSLSSVSAAVFCLAILPVIRDEVLDTPKAVLLMFATLLVTLSKQNVAIPLLFFSVGFLLISDWKSRFRAIVIILIGISAAFVAAFAVLGLGFDAWVYLYSAVLGRTRPLIEMWSDTLRMGSGIAVLAIMAFVVLIFGMTLLGKTTSLALKQRWFFTGLLLVSLLPVLTDWDAKLNNLPFLMIAALLPVLALPVNTALGLDRVVRLSIWLAVVIAALGGWERERMRAVGPFYEPSSLYSVGGYFDGLKTGPWFAVVIQEISTALTLGDNRPVFFGPRLEFGYRFANLASPTGMPLWWHPGSSYALSDESAIAQRFTELNFGLLVFSKGDRTRMPPELVNWIERNYERIEGFQTLDVYRPKTAG
jgi:hypothetical protein